MADQATPVARKFWTLPVEHAEIRLDAFVRQCLPQLSRREVENAIRDGLFSVGEKASKKGDYLVGGDQLVFHGPRRWLAVKPSPADEIDVSIVYEDSSLLFVDKPAGLPTHGFSGRDDSTLANFLLARSPELAEIGKSPWEPGLVHRLDRDTSGLVVVAKTQAAFDNLRSQFRRRRIKKLYWALVWGVTPTQGVIELPLAHDTRDKRRMRVLMRSTRWKHRTWSAVTRYRRIGHSGGLSLLEIDMETGVTHQIRAHMGAIGHPIVADTLYGIGQTKNLGLQRHFLHARSLMILHPDDGRALTVEAELASELAEILRRLKLKF
jgi:23S rRNA pseudouridine1911/1915/1917 synthase